MRYVVTGAAGFIGSHLAEALRARGHDVVGVDCFTDYYDPAEKEENARGLDVQRLDLAEEDLDLDGVDGVFHLAGQPGVRSFGEVFPLYVRRNVLATQRVFEAAAAAGVRVVFASSSSVYGEAEAYPTPEDAQPQPISPYGITKLACEQLAHAYATSFGLDAVALRYFTVYGPRQRPDMFFRRVCDAPRRRAARSRSTAPASSRAASPRSATSSSATIAAMERRAAGRASTTSAAARRRRCSRRSRCSSGSPGGRSTSGTSTRARGDVSRTKADVSRIRDALGWEPRRRPGGRLGPDVVMGLR